MKGKGSRSDTPTVDFGKMSSGYVAFDVSQSSGNGGQWAGAQPGQNLQFMNFDSAGVGNLAAAYSAPANQMSQSYGSGFEDEPPLLEELGIDVALVLKRLKTILNPFKLNLDPMLGEADLSGPLIVCLALGGSHLLLGKVQLGVILGWGVLASLGICWITNMIAGPVARDGGLDVHKCCSLVGYSLLPIVIFALFCLLVTTPLPRAILGILAVAWSTSSCAKLMTAILPMLQDKKMLVAYPCALIYAIFALITVA